MSRARASFRPIAVPTCHVAPGILQRRAVAGLSSGKRDSAADSMTLSRPRDAMRSGQAKVPSVVDDVVRSSGQPLDRDAQAVMGARFGRDFSGVRVHADDRAARSALAVDAQAYTVAPHVVFGPGRYAPHTPQGRQLLAHELTHVVQQGMPSAAPRDLRVAAPSSAAEHEADALSAAPRQHAEAGMLHRSLLGTGIGGALGAGAGGAIGAGIGLAASKGNSGMGALGGVIGGVLGLGAGAVIGELISRDTRSLTPDEKAYAHEIFLESLDYDVITIAKNSVLSLGATRTTKNTINFQDHYFKGNTLELTDRGRLTLVHEMGHVWQYQNEGLAYIPSSLIPQAVAGSNGSRNAAYNWRDAVRNRLPWPSWNAEQQAMCISDYNEALRRTRSDTAYGADDGTQRLKDINTVSMAEPYIGLVRQRIGAPGSHPVAGTAGPGS